MSRQTLNMTDAVYDYLLSCSLRESPALKDCRKVTMKLPGSQMQIAPEQGQFMALLIKMLGAKTVPELGTFTGYSALAMAQALPKSGQIFTCDVDEKVVTLAKQFWAQGGVSHKIISHLMPGLEFLDQLAKTNTVIDFAFIDADKSNYKAYYEKLLAMMPPGGVIAIDNVLWSGKVADSSINDKATRAIRQFNHFLHSDERISLSLVPIADGLSLARKH